MIHFYFLPSTIHLNTDNFSFEYFLNFLEKQFELDYQKVDVLPKEVENQIKIIAKNQGLNLPRLDKPINEDVLVVYDLNQNKTQNIITFYPQIPVVDLELSSLNEISISDFLSGLLLQVVLISKMNLQRNDVFMKISQTKRKIPNLNFKWHLLDY